MTPLSDSSARFNLLLTRICMALLVILAAIYVLIFASVPAFDQLALHGQIATQVVAGTVILSQAMLNSGAAARGLSLPAYLLYNLALNVLIAVGFWLAAGLVAWRAQREWFRWFTALILSFFPSGQFLWQIFAAVHPVAASYLDIISLLWPGFLLFLYLFPDGRAVPRWSRWPMAGILLVHEAVQAVGYGTSLPGSPLVAPAGIQQLAIVIPIGFAFILLCQAYRYWRVADAVMRKQIQWFVAALLLIVLSDAIQAATGGDVTGTSDQGFATDFSNVFVLVIPAAIVIAMLRYRLWEIDVIIRRTLIYAVLTGLLALAYLGSVLVLQRLFQALTGQSQDQVVTVVSTLAIAALFVPLRRRVQRFIDRRFYRRKYDATRILAAFGASAREDVNLDELTGRLVAVVDETIEPSSVGVWLRPPQGK